MSESRLHEPMTSYNVFIVVSVKSLSFTSHKNVLFYGVAYQQIANSCTNELGYDHPHFPFHDLKLSFQR